MSHQPYLPGTVLLSHVAYNASLALSPRLRNEHSDTDGSFRLNDLALLAPGHSNPGEFSSVFALVSKVLNLMKTLRDTWHIEQMISNWGQTSLGGHI